MLDGVVVCGGEYWTNAVELKIMHVGRCCDVWWWTNIGAFAVSAYSLEFGPGQK